MQHPSLEPGSFNFNLCVDGKKSLVHTVCACSKSRRNSDAIGNYRSRLHYVTRIITSSQRKASRASYECFTTSALLTFVLATKLYSDYSRTKALSGKCTTRAP